MRKVSRLPKCCDSLAHRGRFVKVLRLLVIITISGLAVEVCPGLLLVSVALGQDAESEKMILIDLDRRTDPIKVVKVTENGKAVVPGRWQNPEIPGTRFVAGNDWVKNLGFVVKNFASLNIVWIEVILSFLPGDWPAGSDQFDWYLRLGHVPDAAAAAMKSPQLVPKGTNTGPFMIGAGRETIIPLASYAEEIRAAIESRNRRHFSWAAKCAITISHVYFEDEGDYKALKWERFHGYSLPGPEGYYPLGYIPTDVITSH